MNASEVHKSFPPRCLAAILAVVFIPAGIATAQEVKKPAAAKPAAKVPAKGGTTAKGGASTAKGGASTASKAGPTTASKAGPTTPAGRGTTPTTAGRGATPAGRGTPAAGGRAASPAAGRAAGGAGGAHGGAATHTAVGGRTPKGNTVRTTKNGSEVRMRANGRPGDVHDARRGMDVHHGLNGSRRVSVERADHSRIVADRGGHGYVQHPYNYHGREYAHRTYYDHGRAYDRFYNRYQVHGVFVEGYAPAAYFAPGFYGFVYNPWVAPVAYSWGFAATPWFGAYGFYFTPMPVYPTASLWLTDYMISQSLAAGYQAQVAAGAAAQQAAAGAAPEPAPDGAVALTPDVKQMIAAEVQRQIALENQEAQQTAQHQDIDPASSGVGRLLSDNAEHVFVVGNDLDLVDASGTECAMSEGDVLQLPGPPAADATAADLVVVTSKGGQECRKGSSVSVGLADLQDMQNHMRETIDAGMADLQNNQSKGGLPALPASAKAAPVKAEFAAVAPPPDPNAGDQINAQAKEADVSEKEVLADAQSGPSDGGAAAPAAAPAGPPKTIGLGQTIDEVTGILGQPKSVVDLGAKKIYVYPDMKITFNNGKVTDVQ